MDVLIQRWETSSLSQNDAIEKLLSLKTKMVFPDWKEFLSCFNPEYSSYEGIFQDDLWNELAK